MRYLFIAVFCLLFQFVLQGQDSTTIATEKQQQRLESAGKALDLGLEKHDASPRLGKGIRVLFYNTENLFHPENDSLKRDDDFTPRGLKGWSYYRYNQKLSNIYKVIMAVGGWEPPAIIGFCEVENKKTLDDVVNQTPLKKFGYEVIHEESPDRRGIDVGLIYRPEKFQYISHEAINVTFPFDSSLKTRDILHVKGIVLGKDTLSVFVNHWPSRWGGQAKSEPKRTYVASLVRKEIDKLYAANPNAKVVVLGDLNDYSDNISLTEVLQAKGDMDDIQEGQLYNYMSELGKNWQLGSHKYKGHWGTLDHIIVSEPLLHDIRPNHLKASQLGGQIFAARFLLSEDPQYLGLQPFRTYAGPRFLGGFSDHLPIYIDLFYNE